MRMMKPISFYSLISATFMLVSLTACDDERATSYPQAMELKRAKSRGKITGDGLTISGAPEDESGGASPIGVNSFLWRATLDSIAFLPILSADPFGGVVLTDWYEDPNHAGERYKLNILILDKALRADALKVNLFRQVRSATGWSDTAPNPDAARAIEDAILTRARELKLKSGG